MTLAAAASLPGPKSPPCFPSPLLPLLRQPPTTAQGPAHPGAWSHELGPSLKDTRVALAHCEGGGVDPQAHGSLHTHREGGQDCSPHPGWPVYLAQEEDPGTQAAWMGPMLGEPAVKGQIAGAEQGAGETEGPAATHLDTGRGVPRTGAGARCPGTWSPASAAGRSAFPCCAGAQRCRRQLARGSGARPPHRTRPSDWLCLSHPSLRVAVDPGAWLASGVESEANPCRLLVVDLSPCPAG